MNAKTNGYAMYLCAEARQPVFMMFGTSSVFNQLVRSLADLENRGYLTSGTRLIGISAEDSASVDLTSPGYIKEPLMVHIFAS